MTTRRNPQGNLKRVRNIQIRSIRRDPPDVDKLSRALLAIAVEIAQTEKEAQAQAATKGAARDES